MHFIRRAYLAIAVAIGITCCYLLLGNDAAKVQLSDSEEMYAPSFALTGNPAAGDHTYPPMVPKIPDRPHLFSLQEADLNSFPTYEYTSLVRVATPQHHKSKMAETLADQQLLTIEKAMKREPSYRYYNISKSILHIGADEYNAQPYRPCVQSWRGIHPGWNIYGSTLDPADFDAIFKKSGELVKAYGDFEEIRSELMKWITMWYLGGLYVDLDTFGYSSLNSFQPVQDVLKGKKPISLMIGIDEDEPFLSQRGIRQVGLSRGVGFGIKVIWAPERFDPIVRKVIARLCAYSRVFYKSKVPGLDPAMKRQEDMDEVIGKHMFTDTVLDVLSESLLENHKLRDEDTGEARRVTWKGFHKLKEPLWILPEEAKADKRELMPGLAVIPKKMWGSREGIFAAVDSPEHCDEYGSRIRLAKQLH